MRPIATALALALVAAGLGGSAPAGSAAAAGVPIDCPVGMASVDSDGHYRGIRVSGTTGRAPSVTDFGAVAGLTSIRSLATGSLDADVSTPEESYQETTHLGTGTNVIFQLVARADAAGSRATAENLASRWGGFRRTVLASSLLPNHYLYGLHDNGTLYRYRVTYGPGKLLRPRRRLRHDVDRDEQQYRRGVRVPHGLPPRRDDAHRGSRPAGRDLALSHPGRRLRGHQPPTRSLTGPG